MYSVYLMEMNNKKTTTIKKNVLNLRFKLNIWHRKCNTLYISSFARINFFCPCDRFVSSMSLLLLVNNYDLLSPLNFNFTTYFTYYLCTYYIYYIYYTMYILHFTYYLLQRLLLVALVCITRLMVSLIKYSLVFL